MLDVNIRRDKVEDRDTYKAFKVLYKMTDIGHVYVLDNGVIDDTFFFIPEDLSITSDLLSEIVSHVQSKLKNCGLAGKLECFVKG